MTRIAAIDPGVSGAVAMITSTGQVLVEDMPIVGKRVNAGELSRLLTAWRPIEAVVIEDVSARPGNGSVSSFNFGCSFGAVCATVQTMGLPLILVRPNIWKKRMGLNQDKERSRQLAINLFPAASGRLARKKDDGRAEALLLAHDYLRTLDARAPTVSIRND